MIAKKIHYVWVGGGKKTEIMLACIESWKKFCPDYEIIEWNESNFDINESPLIKKALDNKNWALAADVIRIMVLYKYGGVYLDTDLELIKPIDELLKNEFFAGYESKFWLNTAIIGSVPKHPILETAVKLYKSEISMAMSNLLTVHLLSAIIKKLYKISANGKTIHASGISLYEKEWFYPIDYLTLKFKKTENTHAIHYYIGTWGSKKQLKLLGMIRKVTRRIFHFLLTPFVWMVALSYRMRNNKHLKRSQKL